MLKRGIILIALILSLSILFSGCLYVRIGDGNVIVGNGKMDKKTVTIESGVTGVDNRASIDVVIDPELDGEAVIEAESNIIDYVELKQNASGSLTVDFKKSVNVTLSRGVTVRIPAVKGGTIAVNGSGNITGNGLLESDAFDIRIMGSGDISLKLAADHITTEINGSGNVTLEANTGMLLVGVFGSGDILVKGTAQSLGVSVNGSGNFDAAGCAAESADVMVAGSGDISVNVSSELTGSINGSGNVFYSGDPGTVSVTSDGSGDLIKR